MPIFDIKIVCTRFAQSELTTTSLSSLSMCFCFCSVSVLLAQTDSLISFVPVQLDFDSRRSNVVVVATIFFIFCPCFFFHTFRIFYFAVCRVLLVFLLLVVFHSTVGVVTLLSLSFRSHTKYFVCCYSFFLLLFFCISVSIKTRTTERN